MLVLSVRQAGTEKWVEAGRTERLTNTLEPDWARKLPLDYFFEQRQQLRFEVYDSDSDCSKLKHSDFLGRTEVSLGAIVGAPGSRIQRVLEGCTKGGNGTLLVSAEELSADKTMAMLEWEGKKLDNKDLLGKSDPFLTISRLNQDQSKTLLHRSEVVQNDLSPVWKPCKLSVHSLTLGQPTTGLLLEVFDHDDDGGHDLIGQAQSCYQQLAAAANGSISFEVHSRFCIYFRNRR